LKEKEQTLIKGGTGKAFVVDDVSGVYVLTKKAQRLRVFGGVAVFGGFELGFVGFLGCIRIF
jgi:hypothetical protein